MERSGAPRAVFAMPAHNAGAHIAEALGSLLAQTDPRLAVVVVDDASTDGTAERVREIAGADRRLTLHVNPRRLGLSGNWNAAYHAARAAHPDAPYFAWAGHHDWWAPEWLERLAAALEATPGAVLAHPLDARLTADG